MNAINNNTVNMVKSNNTNVVNSMLESSEHFTSINQIPAGFTVGLLWSNEYCHRLYYPLLGVYYDYLKGRFFEMETHESDNFAGCLDIPGYEQIALENLNSGYYILVEKPETIHIYGSIDLYTSFNEVKGCQLGKLAYIKNLIKNKVGYNISDKDIKYLKMLLKYPNFPFLRKRKITFSVFENDDIFNYID